MRKRLLKHLVKRAIRRAIVEVVVLGRRTGYLLEDLIELPLKVVSLPFTLPYDIAGFAERGFGVPELISNISCSAVFAIATFGTYNIAFELGSKVVCPRHCHICNGWQAMQCTMCKGSGTVQYQVKSYTLRSGEKATAESISDAIADNRAELLHLPSTLDLHSPLPTKECPTCDGT